MSPHSELDRSYANPMAAALPLASVFPAFSDAARDAVPRDLIARVAGADPAWTPAARDTFSAAEADRQRDRLVCLLVADLLQAEIAAHDAAADAPEARAAAARCVLGLRVLRPAMLRQGHDLDTLATGPVEIARAMVERVQASKTDADYRMLQVTLH
ncbi:MAG: hypothetical protein KIS96_08615 [Bauldia sp.]|nr:hypothetical protein [Bauldia sp.]